MILRQFRKILLKQNDARIPCRLGLNAIILTHHFFDHFIFHRGLNDSAEEEIRRSVDFLKSYLQTYPFLKSLVLGISGGQDSTLVGKLCQMAISELREETGNDALQFIAVRLPYGVQADE